MKKSGNQFSLKIKGDTVQFGNYTLKIYDNVNNWISNFRKSDYSIDKSNEYFVVYEINIHKGVYIYAKADIVFQVSVSLFPNLIRFEGDFIVENKKIPSPFLSSEVQAIFPGINLQTVNSIDKDSFDPSWSNYHSNSDSSRLKIYVDRNIKFISLICLEGLK